MLTSTFNLILLSIKHVKHSMFSIVLCLVSYKCQFKHSFYELEVHGIPKGGKFIFV
jgi:hypothetical protein